jgi:hypothetical protein
LRFHVMPANCKLLGHSSHLPPFSLRKTNVRWALEHTTAVPATWDAQIREL